jgi:hypothetical protein
VRFYNNDGDEIDVQDIKFHVDENALKDLQEVVEEIINNEF